MSDLRIEVIRTLRHEPCRALGEQAALILREIALNGVLAYELRQHGSPGCMDRFGSRGEAEAYLDGYLAGVNRSALVAAARLLAGAADERDVCDLCDGSGETGVRVGSAVEPCPKCSGLGKLR